MGLVRVGIQASHVKCIWHPGSGAECGFIPSFANGGINSAGGKEARDWMASDHLSLESRAISLDGPWQGK